MKRHNRFTSLISFILFFAILLQPVHASELLPSAASQASDSASSSSSVPADDPLRMIVYDCIDQYQTSVTHESTRSLSEDYLRAVLMSLQDIPEFFYLSSIDVSLSTRTVGGTRTYIYLFTPAYTMDRSAIPDAKAFWEAEVGKILSIATPEMTDLEKALVFHDYLCTNFSYDTSLTIYDTYSFLVQKTGVCEAYADLYAALLTRSNIPNQFAISEEMNHIWNIVQIDGEWYHIDVTWDDPTEDQPGKALHTAFLRSDEGIRQLDHTSWTAEVACTSTKYDNSFITEFIAGTVTDGSYFYAVSKQQKAILRCDLRNMTAEKLIDLSGYRWMVWDKPFYWDAIYTNLYCDGMTLYFSTPQSIETYELSSGERATLAHYEQGGGYLYAMRYDAHQLICTVSTQPSASEGEFAVELAHKYQETANGILVTTTCIICKEASHTILPAEGTVMGVTSSKRPTPDVNGYHDIRIAFALNSEAVAHLGQIEYTFRLIKTDGTAETFTFHSEKDDFSAFLSYDALTANGTAYTVGEQNRLLGFIIGTVGDASWTTIELTVKEVTGQTLLYSGRLGYDQLV